MPYASEKQRRYMWSQHPEIAEKWAEKGHGYVKAKKKKGLKKGKLRRMWEFHKKAKEKQQEALKRKKIRKVPPRQLTGR